MSYLSRTDISVSISIAEKFLYKAIKHSCLAKGNRWGVPYTQICDAVTGKVKSWYVSTASSLNTGLSWIKGTLKLCLGPSNVKHEPIPLKAGRLWDWELLGGLRRENLSKCWGMGTWDWKRSKHGKWPERREKDGGKAIRNNVNSTVSWAHVSLRYLTEMPQTWAHGHSYNTATVALYQNRNLSF